MGGDVVVVFAEPSTLRSLAISLKWAGYRVCARSNPLVVLDDLDEGQPVDVLATQIELGDGVPSGLSLAVMVRQRRPDLRLVFMGAEKFRKHVAGLGPLLTPPPHLARIRQTIEGAMHARRLLRTINVDSALRHWAHTQAACPRAGVVAARAGEEADPCSWVAAAEGFQLSPE